MTGPAAFTPAAFTPAARRLATLATGVLGWRPADFWAATPADLATALAPLTPDADQPDPAALARLMKEHPDG